MSDWEVVNIFVKRFRYTPIHLSLNEYIATILLHYEGCLESDGIDTATMPIVRWLETFDANYRLEDFDYR